MAILVYWYTGVLVYWYTGAVCLVPCGVVNYAALVFFYHTL